MNFSLFPNSRPNKIPNDERQIKVSIINDEKPLSYILVNLYKEKTLRDARKILSSTEEVLMGWQNAFFCNKLKKKIPISQEDKYKLEDVLIPENDHYLLIIEINQLPSFPKIIRQHDIEKGYMKLKDGSLVAAEHSAFFIKNSHLMSITLNYDFQSICKKTRKNFDQIWIKSLEEEGFDFLDEEIKNENDKLALSECTITYCENGSIILSYKDLEATKEYIKAIESALDENLPDERKVEALNDVGKNYGFFWIQEFKLGKKFVQVTQNEETRHKAVGGDYAKHQNISEWLKSPGSYNEWGIINYGPKLPLYLLLSEEIQLKIKKLIGEKILYTDVHNFRIANYDLSLPIILQVPLPANLLPLSDCKLFATILNKADRKPYKNVFALRIDYLNDDTPYFVIHHIGAVPNLPQTIDLSISWMVIGYEKNFPLEPFVNNSSLKYIWTREQDNTNILLPNPIPHNHAWVTTIILRCNKNHGYRFARSLALISHHISQLNDRMTTNVRLNVHNHNNPLNFEINCTILSENDNGGLIPVIVEGPTNQRWQNRRTRGFLSNDRRLFTSRWQLANNDNYRLPNNDNYLIFASLLCLNANSVQGCNDLSLNISPKYAIIKSPNNLGNNPNCRITYIVLRKP
ncbi:16420_t:CDS:2 [Dentiscutata heterogama]|uniref:16420_t:CDS:1 n=1 Tax=Dentiscutata heterogama TaxID=1316150 RepID=A0ACA9KBC9_9GLOM|nr:16420_t:CDS:2 [Dentiscutata heterogama]